MTVVYLTDRSVRITMKENSKTKQKEATRKKIMDISLNLFSSERYDTVSMAKIAKGVGISKGNLYNYFESKDQMLSEIVLNAAKEIYRDIDANHDGEISHEEFIQFIHDVFENFKANQKFWKLMFSLLLQPKILEIIQTKLGTTSQNIMGLFYSYFSKQYPDDMETELVFFSSLLKGALMQYAFAPEVMNIDKLRDKIIAHYSSDFH